METVQIKHTAYNFYKNYEFVPPCEDAKWCTSNSNVKVGYKDLSELEAPGQDGKYTRCGKIKTDECMNFQDVPYNNPYHPTVHWGRSILTTQLINCLSRKWVNACSKCSLFTVKLVISDISLPGGGLLDIDHNWGTEPEGHIRHRHGTDADLVGRSVRRLCGCGEPPEKTWSLEWLTPPNPLWTGIKIGRSCGLTYPIPVINGVKKKDPGHVCIRLGENICR
jgi:hypothetical protein